MYFNSITINDQLYETIVNSIITDNVLTLSHISNQIDLRILDQNYGNIFLILAIQHVSLNVIQYLLDILQFDIRAKNSSGECPFDYAIRDRNHMIRTIFSNHKNNIKPLSLKDTASLSKRKRLNSGIDCFTPISSPKDCINNSIKSTPSDIQKRFIEKLDKLQLSSPTKELIQQKINTISTYNGNADWLESFFKIPFNNFATLPVNRLENKIEDIRNYFVNVKLMLDKSTYGMDHVKEEIIDIVAQLVSSPQSQIKVIGLCGSPGIGKTHLIKNGLAKILERPFQHLCMGGVSDASYLVGHSHTYTNSKYGTIVNCLIDAKVMNPIIFMDEVDKISNSDKGVDLQNVLIHLTDPVQNNSFIDKYFQNIEIDISRVMFVFSFNDESRIDPILKDRIHIIRLKNPSIEDKVNIAKYHLIPSILSNINLPFVEFTDKHIRLIIDEYCRSDAGVRSLKRMIESLLLKINTSIYNPCSNYKSLKYLLTDQIEHLSHIKVSNDMIKEILIKPEDEFDHLYGRMYL